MKTIPAIISAFLVTAAIAVAMLLIGGNALLNTDTTPVSDTVQAAAPASFVQQGQVSADAQQVQQLQQRIQEYQQREKQYQTELNQAAQRLNDANQQLNAANQQIQVYQQVLQALQERGIIRISRDGRIYLGNGF